MIFTSVYNLVQIQIKSGELRCSAVGVAFLFWSAPNRSSRINRIFLDLFFFMLGNWFRCFCITTTNSWKPLETFRRNVLRDASVPLFFIYLYINTLHVIYVRLLHMSVLPVCSWTSVTAVSTVSAQSLCVFALSVDIVLLFFVSLSCFLCPGFWSQVFGFVFQPHVGTSGRRMGEGGGISP